MIWYENIYLGDSLANKPHKVRRIKWKIKHGAGTIRVYVIVLCRYGTNLLEIIPARELLQKVYPKQHLYAVGLACGYEEALETAAKIVSDVYQAKGDFRVGQFFYSQSKAFQKAGDKIC